jgi:hypothetical protein
MAEAELVALIGQVLEEDLEAQAEAEELVKMELMDSAEALEAELKILITVEMVEMEELF